MARRRRVEKRRLIPDTKYQSELMGKFITQIMRKGKRAVAEGIVYGALEHIRDKINQEPLEVFQRAIDNVKPHLEVKSRRVGGATYQVPIEVSSRRQISLALRWITQYAKTRKGMSMRKALALELMDAANQQGASVKKRDDTHKMAQANRAFAHYRW